MGPIRSIEKLLNGRFGSHKSVFYQNQILEMRLFCRDGAQRAKFAKKVHKPPLRVNVINFELSGFNASIFNMVPLESLRPQKSCDALIEVFKFIRYAEIYI